MQSGPLCFLFSGGPALTVYPARAVGCLSDKYGVVCSKELSLSNFLQFKILQRLILNQLFEPALIRL